MDFIKLLVWVMAWSSLPAMAAGLGEKTIDALLQEAWAKNPEIQMMLAKQQAMLEMSDAAGYWPDPMISGNYFLKPIETRLGEQKANIMLTQPVPFPGKFSAKEDEKRLQSEAMGFEVEAMKLMVATKIKSLYYKAYALQKRIDFNKAEKAFLQDLSQVALARVSVGTTGQQDVTQATLEISRLEQSTLQLEQDLRSIAARINEQLNRPAWTRIHFARSLAIPTQLVAKQGWKKWLAAATRTHPKAQATTKRMSAADAGIKYSKLRAIPDLKVSFSYFVIDEDNPNTPTGTNEDAYAVGAGISIPIWWGKYSSFRDEAYAQKQAATFEHASIVRTAENDLVDLWEQAETSKELLNIYRATVLPQAEQVLSANQSAYQQGSVTFDRVISDFQKVLMLKTAHYQEQAKFLTLIAKIEEKIGGKLTRK